MATILRIFLACEVVLNNYTYFSLPMLPRLPIIAMNTLLHVSLFHTSTKTAKLMIQVSLNFIFSPSVIHKHIEGCDMQLQATTVLCQFTVRS